MKVQIMSKVIHLNITHTHTLVQAQNIPSEEREVNKMWGLTATVVMLIIEELVVLE